MTKTIREIREDIKLVDMVIEIADARAPRSTRNPDIDALSQGKARVLILSKADLADENETRRWIAWYGEKNIRCVAVDSRAGGVKKLLLREINSAAEEKRARDRARGMKERPVRAMVAGIPNVGKSTLINSFAGRATAKTGNKPGVTRGRQWIRLAGNVELLDTPGLLWPKFEDPAVGENIALIGSINDQILDTGELADLLIGRLRTLAPEAIMQRFGAEDGRTEEVLSAIALKRGCLKAGGEADLGRAAGLLLDDFRAGRLGRLTLESAPGKEEAL